MTPEEEARPTSATPHVASAVTTPVSPLATGGAGTIFEYRLAGVALAALLRGDSVLGLAARVDEVGLQRREVGHPLDDIVLAGQSASGVRVVSEYQVKRRLLLTSANADFLAVVREALNVIEAHPEEVDARRHRVGMAAGAPRGPLEALDALTEIARSHATLGSFAGALTSSNAPIRDRHSHLRDAIRIVRRAGHQDDLGPDELDAITWRLTAALDVRVVEVEDSGRDVTEAINRLRDLIPAGNAISAEILFAQLVEIAETWGPRAAQITAPMLRAELERRGVALSVDPRRADDLERLRISANATLGAIPTAIGSTLRLPRQPLVDRFTEALQGPDPVLLTGPAGVGKTTLAAIGVTQLRDQGATVVAIALTGRTGQRIADLEAELDVRLQPALRSAATTGRRVLFIDGAEQALTDAGALLGELIRVVPIESTNAPSWHVVVTARDEAADAVGGLVAQATERAPVRLAVDDLTDDEIAEILTVFPRLQPLDRHPRPRRLLRRPYLVDLLVRATVHSDLPDAVVAEESVVDVVYGRLVRRADGALPGRGAPDHSSDIFLAMAEGILAGNTVVRLDARDAEARAGMVSDDLLRPVRASFRFAHDILADYSVATRLLEHDGPSTLNTVSSPRRVLRGVRLWMQHRLASASADQSGAVWTDITRVASDLAARDGPRWLDSPFEALINLGHPTPTLDALVPLLLAEEGAGLAKLIDAARRLGRTRTPPGDDLRQPIDPAACAPVVMLMANNAAAVPSALWPAALGLVRGTLAALLVGPPAAFDELLPNALALSDAIVAWSSERTWGDPFDDALVALGLLAGRLSNAARAFLIEKTQQRPADIAVLVEDPIAGTALARADPDLALRLAGSYYVNRDVTLESADEIRDLEADVSHPWYHVEWSAGLGGDDEGVRDHSPSSFRLSQALGLAHPTFGPFAALLAASPPHGLRLVGMVVDLATRARIQLEATWGDNEIVIEIQLPEWPSPRTYRGTGHVYMWYRRISVGPYSAMSALMALRQWAADSVRDDRTLREVVDDILTTGESIAFVAVAFSLLVDHVEETPPEFDVFLAQPAIWHLEIARVVAEQTGLALPAPESPRLRSTPSDIAMELVLRSDERRRELLKEVGQKLLPANRGGTAPTHDGANAASPDVESDPDQAIGQDELLLRRRWAAELDVDIYKAEPHKEGILISVDYPTDVVRGLEESGGRRSAQFLELSSLGFQACQMRDGASDAEPVPVWTRLHELHAEIGAEDLARLSPFGQADGLAAAAAALILAAHSGRPVPDDVLSDAASFLLDVAQAVASEPFDHQLSRDRRMVWEMGADRSAATALPVLLADEAIRDRSRVSIDDVSAALVALASSVFAEVRTRLGAGLLPIWDAAYEGEPHAIALAVLQELVRTSGLGAWQQSGYRPRIRLDDPLEHALESPGLVIMPESASDALPGLIAASRLDCPHAAAAQSLLRALVDVDLRVWPMELARHHYDMGHWRGELDRLTAELALDGDPSQLRRYLASFAPVGEDLRGLLDALARAATSPERAAALHDLWPEIFEALLPELRSLDDSSEPRPYHRDIDALDEALLPMPPEGVAWPLDRTVLLFWRWVGAFRGVPHVADRAIQFLARCGWLPSENATGAVLIVLGDHVESISRESRFVVAWLDLVLRVRPDATGQHAALVRTLLDRLAAHGDEGALRLQAALEA